MLPSSFITRTIGDTQSENCTFSIIFNYSSLSNSFSIFARYANGTGFEWQKTGLASSSMYIFADTQIVPNSFLKTTVCYSNTFCNFSPHVCSQLAIPLTNFYQAGLDHLTQQLSMIDFWWWVLYSEPLLCTLQSLWFCVLQPNLWSWQFWSLLWFPHLIIGLYWNWGTSVNIHLYYTGFPSVFTLIFKTDDQLERTCGL